MWKWRKPGVNPNRAGRDENDKDEGHAAEAEDEEKEEEEEAEKEQDCKVSIASKSNNFPGVLESSLSFVS